jgi:hypothetical protein
VAVAAVVGTMVLRLLLEDLVIPTVVVVEEEHTRLVVLQVVAPARTVLSLLHTIRLQ